MSTSIRCVRRHPYTSALAEQVANDSDTSAKRRRRNADYSERSVASHASILVTLIEQIHIGVLILAAGRRIVYFNAAAHAILRGRTSVRMCNGCLIATDVRMATSLASWDKAINRRAAWILALHDARLSHDRGLLHVVRPSLRRRLDPNVLLLFEPQRSIELPIFGLKDVYSLTDSESHVAEKIVSGRCLQVVAHELGISIHTVRTHLKRIFAKCDVRTQAGLVRVILSGPASILGQSQLSRTLLTSGN